MVKVGGVEISGLGGTGWGGGWVVREREEDLMRLLDIVAKSLGW